MYLAKLAYTFNTYVSFIDELEQNYSLVTDVKKLRPLFI